MRLLFVGDISLGEYYLTFGHGPRTELKRRDILQGLEGVFEGADIIAGNLEASLTNNRFNEKDPDRFVLRGEPSQAEYLRTKGFNVLQVANNHTVQHGKEGFDETVECLRAQGITPIGLHNQPLQILTVKDKTVGFYAASDVPDNTDKGQMSYQRLDDAFVRQIKDSVSKVDYLFVMLHWGLEESTRPMEYQKRLINELIDAGVKGVIGSHPHLFYEIWRQSRSVAAPSLGNFVFDLCWDERLLKTGILDVVIEDEDIQIKVWPVEITMDGAVPVLTGPPVAVNERVELYDLGESMNRQILKKVSFFLMNFWKGRSDLKAKFIVRKILGRLSTI